MPAPFAALRAVLFDLDGTLIETHIDFPAMTAAMQELARAHSVPASVTEGKDILGLVDAAAEYVQERGGDGLALRRTAFAELEAMEIAGCAHPNLLPGTHELLSGLVNRGLKVGIVTRNCRAVSVRLLARFALPHHLLLTRDDVPKTKPNPEHLWAALEYLGESPEHTAMVGDHWMDIQAGVRAGCAATLGILGRNDAAWFAPCPPSALARDLSEAAPWFGG
jgi:phosphoglycolate phosphatase